MVIACLSPSIDADRGDSVGLGDGAAHLLHADAHGGEQRRVDAHANGRLLGAADLHLGDARHLRDALRDDGVGGVVDGAGCQALRRQRQDEHRRRRRIGLAERRHVGRSPGRSAAAALSAACTSRAAPSMSRVRSNCTEMLAEPSELDRGHLGHAGDLAEAALERRGDGRRHGLRGRRRGGWLDADGRETRSTAGWRPAARSRRRCAEQEQARSPAAPCRWAAG